MTLTVQPAVEFPLSTLCDIINRSFKGYVGGDINFTPAILASFMASADVRPKAIVAMARDRRSLRRDGQIGDER